MSNYQPVSKTEHANLRWKRFDSYQFAAQDAVVPLVVQELAKACLTLPIAFIRQNDQFVTAALQGLQPGQNLFVAPDGRWMGPYTPAAYRGYPFALAAAENDQLILCVDTESGLIGAHQDQPFFDDQGEVAKPVKDVLDFLQQVRNNQPLTQRLCAALDAEQLIVPWELKIQSDSGERLIQGLYRIDEERLKGLDSAAITRIHQAGALPVAYCQLLSMQHIHTLGKLVEAHAKTRAQPALDNLDGLFGESDAGFNFNFH